MVQKCGWNLLKNCLRSTRNCRLKVIIIVISTKRKLKKENKRINIGIQDENMFKQKQKEIHLEKCYTMLIKLLIAFYIYNPKYWTKCYLTGWDKNSDYY